LTGIKPTIDPDRARRIASQEERLAFERFDADPAWTLGEWLQKAPIAIDIQLHSMPLFYCALPGSTPDNTDWIRGKRNLVLRTSRSSYRIGLTLAQQQTTLGAQTRLPLRDFATHGGDFPVTLARTGCIGPVIVSGQKQQDDHNLVVEGLLLRTVGTCRKSHCRQHGCQVLPPKITGRSQPMGPPTTLTKAIPNIYRRSEKAPQVPEWDWRGLFRHFRTAIMLLNNTGLNDETETGFTS
jgi:uncharacterized protein (UPF0303 family)